MSGDEIDKIQRLLEELKNSPEVAYVDIILSSDVEKMAEAEIERAMNSPEVRVIDAFIGALGKGRADEAV